MKNNLNIPHQNVLDDLFNYLLVINIFMLNKAPTNIITIDAIAIAATLFIKLPRFMFILK